MSDAGSRDGFGSPPWDPIDPPGGSLDATGELPALGATGELPVMDAVGDATGGDTSTGTAGGARVGPSGDSEPAGGQEAIDERAGDRGDQEGQDDSEAGGSERSSGGGTRRGRRGKGKPGRLRRLATELLVLAVIAITLALVIKTYVVQAFYIPSGSMENTLEVGDRVLINKVVYHTRGIARGDIVVFDGNGSWDPGGSSAPPNPLVRFWDDLQGVLGESSGNIYIKRVVGLPGDHVACCNKAGQVTVDGAALSESGYLYPGNPPSLVPFSIVVPPGRLWVMGDHRDISYDSRGHLGDPGGGTIPESGVLGRAFVVIWPASRWGILNIPATFEQPGLTGSAATAGGSPATLAAALQDGTPVTQAWTPLPLALGSAGAIPLGWLQYRIRRRIARRRARQ